MNTQQTNYRCGHPKVIYSNQIRSNLIFYVIKVELIINESKLTLKLIKTSSEMMRKFRKQITRLGRPIDIKLSPDSPKSTRVKMDLKSESKDSDSADVLNTRSPLDVSVWLDTTSWDDEEEDSNPECTFDRHANKNMKRFFQLEYNHTRVFYFFYLLIFLALARGFLAIYYFFTLPNHKVLSRFLAVFLLYAAVSSGFHYHIQYTKFHIFEEELNASFVRFAFLTEFCGWMGLGFLMNMKLQCGKTGI